MRVGVDLAGKMGGFSPYGRLIYRHNIDGGNRDIGAILNGESDTAFTVSGAETGKPQFDVDAGLNFGVGASATIFVGYQGSFRDDLNRHCVNGGFRFSF